MSIFGLYPAQCASVLQFSIYRSLVSLGRYIPKYFILSVTMVNGIVSLISLPFLNQLGHLEVLGSRIIEACLENFEHYFTSV